jgi:serine/threonine protein kinase
MSYIVPKSKGISLEINSKISNTEKPTERVSDFQVLYDPYGIATQVMDTIVAGSTQSKVVQLGRGAFGYVSGYMTSYTPHSSKGLPLEFAVKTIDKTGNYDKQLLDNEINAHKYLLSLPETAKYVPELYAAFDAVFDGIKQRFIVMEWFKEGATLGDYVDSLRNKGLYTNEIYNELKKKIIAAVSASLNAGVIHRDLKPQNIFVVWNPDLQIKIIDFGLAVRRGSTSPVAGTPQYMSPELKNKTEHTYNKKNNIHSVWQILHNIAPPLNHPLKRPVENMVNNEEPRVENMVNNEGPRIENMVNNEGSRIENMVNNEGSRIENMVNNILEPPQVGGKRSRQRLRSRRHRRSKSARRRRTSRK